ncbi:MAG: hypothetical protein A2700_02020 [Candidatus Blackburnbacteria bacterium RIFCSPHIGHO2_01_FULL_44_64]|uniref:BrnT family toxin n=1 Tax=Candidatus Blackburnbacteria bacterium RIFCSPHIGHO2_02_FULL_44_20 TaxID=1797516 RepID=A0A1G1V9X2_9BACT|nr:MAG: hypothetical protein A2700_02020 [Candidatus Blackburnbacteria bacterium RIFCSPHIGHO2_01_FULL_44_64]OGY10482.1 MAG: hypothetical protein A3E16_04295 [Candidatus Blackburnbacteria bacterium RIFCSPHIGHO2_12_FULL_44_25]OGY12240.1 MAG: hypothetical protein A3D26_02205 [Candidatus Blackburnbacteria bacterium RIFCSPHIGHO2_02_FULL_44_20]OGY15115.1 MAG: hypothetical protein A3A62_00220 [Candidatus Blackburnbacteria bacterium RIFCSPLOWO2_01_FULL_44_43]OGY15233.1 MAG: hypothetical protein A3H88_0
MYSVTNPSKIIDFEWDRWNLEKSLKKHKITPKESEEIFLDKDQLVLKDIKHSQKEARFNIIGKTTKKKVLFATFTLRSNKVRIISARSANAKERKLYEKI